MALAKGTRIQDASDRAAPPKRKTAKPKPVPKRVSKPPSRLASYPEHQAAATMVAPLDRYKAARTAFFKEVPYDKRLIPHPGSLQSYMKDYAGTMEAGMRQQQYLDRLRAHTHSASTHKAWLQTREQEWKDLLSGKTEREQHKAFLAPAAHAKPPVDIFKYVAKHGEKAYSAKVKQFREAERQRLEGEYKRMLRDPNAYYEKESLKPHDTFGKIAGMGISGLEFMGLPRSVSNDLRLISAGFAPAIAQSFDAAVKAAKGDPDAAVKMIDETIHQYRQNYIEGGMKGAFSYAAKHPLLFGLDASILLAPTAKLGSIGLLSRNIRLANKGAVSWADAAGLAVRESARPGYARSLGYKGGLQPRTLVGKDMETEVTRPISRSPIGRTGQRVYDVTSRGLERGPFKNAPVLSHLTPSSRAAAAIAKEERRGRERVQAVVETLNDPVLDFTTKKGKARLKKLIGRVVAEPGRGETLVAALEAGVDSGKALSERVAALRDVLDQGIMWERGPIESPERDQFVSTLNERFGAEQAQALTTLTDAMARARNPSRPEVWYRQHLAESSNMSAEAFLRSGAAETARFQLDTGRRRGLIETGKTRLVDPDEPIETVLNGMDHDRRAGNNYGAIFYTLPDGKTGVIEPSGAGFTRFDFGPDGRTLRGDPEIMTTEEASDFLRNETDQKRMYVGNEGAAMAFDTPVFYSPLQRAVESLPGSGMKANSLKKALFKLGITKLEWEAMGMDAFFKAQTTRQVPGYTDRRGEWHPGHDVTDEYARIAYDDLLYHLGDQLNAYNLDEVVRRHDSQEQGGYGERSYRTIYNDYGGVFIAKHPNRDEPYYELTMVLKDSAPQLRRHEKEYYGEGHSHWEETNVVAHVRFHIIFDDDGKRALLLDEIQSDWASNWHEAGRPGWRMTPEEREEIADLHRKIEGLSAELRPLLVKVAEVRDADRRYYSATYAVEDWPGGDLDELGRLQEEQADALATLNQLEEENRGNRDRRMELEAKREEHQSTLRKIEQRHKIPPPPLQGDEVHAAVRRMTRWAAEADVDRIIIVPGEMQSYRNIAYDRLPDGKVVTTHRQYGGDVDEKESWRGAFAHMDAEELEAYGRSPVARNSGLAPTFFKLYEEEIPAMFERTLGVKGGRRERIFRGYYADQLRGIPEAIGEHLMSGYVIDLTPEAKAKGLATHRFFQSTPQWSELPRGATAFLEDGRTVMRLFEGAEVDTVIHELAHIALSDLDPDSLKILEGHFGGPLAEWTPQQHEAFARGFEYYLYSGKAPTLELQRAFQKIRQWIASVWHAIKQDPEKFALPAEVDQVFERIVLPRDRSPLNPDERAHVETQIRELEDALRTPMSKEQHDAALESLQTMSEMVEDHGREILLFGADRTPDPDTGLSEYEIEAENVDEMFARRRGAYTDLLKSMGVIDPDDATTRAGGYFPNLHIARSGGAVPIEPTKLPASGNVLGVPKPRKDALNIKRNQFVRFQTGMLGMDPGNLLDVLRMRIKHLSTLKLRQRLYDHGEPVVRGQTRGGYDRKLMYIRDPKEDAVKLKERTRAALDLDEDSYRALVERGEDPVGDMDIHNPSEQAQGAFEDGVWWVGKDGRSAPPPWVETETTIRTVPRQIAQKLFGDVFPSAPFGTVVPQIANALARISMLYAPGILPGSRYVVRNFIQNAVLAGLTHPSHLRYALYAIRKLDRDHPELGRLIDAESGSTRAEAAMPERYTKAQTRGQELGVQVGEAQRYIGGKLSRVADEPFRRSMWIGYAEKYGFHGPEGWERLLKSEDENIVHTRTLISQAVRDDLIDFDAMSANERRFASNYLFLYPFVRGSLKWPFMYMREYPFRAGLIGSLAANEGEQRDDEALAKTSGESARTKLRPGERQYDYGWLDPWNPASQTLESISAAFQGMSKNDLSALQQMLSPEYRAAVQSLTGSASKTRPWGSLLTSFVPGASTYQKAQRGGSLADQFLRHMGFSVELTPSRYLQRKQAAADLTDAWAWAQQQGQQLDPEAVQKSVRAYEKYKDLEQRIDFSQKDLGEGSLRTAELSPAQTLEREQQKAMALTLAVAEGFPEYREQMSAEVKKIRSADLATLQAYNEALQEMAFAERNDLINSWKRETGG